MPIAFDFQPCTRLVFGEGALERLGELARELGFRRTLLVADRGLVESGHVDEALAPLKKAGIEVFPFQDFDVNPDTRMIERGRDFAAPLEIDSIIGLGGGSSLDCAKGINFLLTNGGQMKDYWGYGKATKPMLPMIGVPTTAGTGSEAQSYALISEYETRVKMACGDRQAAFRVALLDPLLTVSQPAQVTAAAGFDALAHAVETYVTTKRNPLSEMFSREAWRLLAGNYERVLSHPHDTEARGRMQLGAHFAGIAIENSMLGATHACANPLTQHYGTTHGVAIAALLPTVVRWNSPSVAERYREFAALLPNNQPDNDGLARRLEELAAAASLPTKLSALDIPQNALPLLAENAATQWTGQFNPRALDAAGALEIYQRAY
ncbi:MAG: iron-containing alcohol dehydrogenase [Acidobacteriota bacterium]|nr:iron-containing alcohol dehydrogenase [Acidobacteriota bacterium]